MKKPLKQKLSKSPEEERDELHKKVKKVTVVSGRTRHVRYPSLDNYDRVPEDGVQN